jgi:hypothetical protein
VGALSKYYLRPSTSLALPLSVEARFARLIVPAPRPLAARVDTPPPQLPG